MEHEGGLTTERLAMTPLVSPIDIAWAVFTVSLACAEVLVALVETRHHDDRTLA